MAFPENFLWGGAISALQAEGGFGEGGRGELSYDHLTVGSRTEPRHVTDEIDPNEFYPSHKGNDFYHRYKEDIALMGELGLKVFRLSINWGRIFPHGDDAQPNAEGVAFYHAVFDELHKWGIEPLVTIFHAEVPHHLALEFDGWYSRRMIDLFVRYCEFIFTEYKDDVKYWLTLNEMNSMLLKSTPYWYCGMATANTRTQGNGGGSDQDLEDLRRQYQCVHHAFVASAKAVKLAHAINPDFRVGCMVGGVCQYPYSCNPGDMLAAQEERRRIFWFVSDVMVRGEYPTYARKLFRDRGVKLQVEPGDEQDLREGTVDFYSFSYYSTGCVTTSDDVKKTAGNLTFGAANPYLRTSEWGWQIDPEGLHYFLNEIYDRYRVPIMIVENGLGQADVLEADGSVHDPYRIEYVREHVKAMDAAIEDGVDLVGYTPWGIVDLPSVSTGEMSKRYGLVYVDADDLGNGTYDRYRKDSFFWYRRVVASNGEDLG